MDGRGGKDMFAVGFILFMFGASGITDMHGDLQPGGVVMIAVGMALLLLGQKRREARGE